MTQTPPPTAIETASDLYAVLMNGNWSIATAVPAAKFGVKDSEHSIWSEQDTTAWIGHVGKEEMAINLSRRCLDTADGVDDETRAFVDAVQLIEDAGWVVLRPEQVASRPSHNAEVGVKAEPVAWLTWIVVATDAPKLVFAHPEAVGAFPVFASRTPNTEAVVKAVPEREPVACAYRSRPIGTLYWSYSELQPSGPSVHLFEVQPLYASPPSPAEVTGDMALVPRIETDAMCEAGLEALRENLGHSSVIMRDAAACYRAMVSVASPLQLNKKS